MKIWISIFLSAGDEPPPPYYPSCDEYHDNSLNSTGSECNSPVRDQSRVTHRRSYPMSTIHNCDEDGLPHRQYGSSPRTQDNDNSYRLSNNNPSYRGDASNEIGHDESSAGEMNNTTSTGLQEDEDLSSGTADLKLS